MSTSDLDLNIIYDLEKHTQGNCEGLAGGCVHCILEGIQELMRRGMGLDQIQAKIIACNDDSAEAVMKMLEKI